MLCEKNAFGDGGDVDANNQLVGKFGSLAGTDGAHVGRLTKMPEYGRNPSKDARSSLGACKDRKRAKFSAVRAARNGCVGISTPRCVRSLTLTPGACWTW